MEKVSVKVTPQLSKCSMVALTENPVQLPIVQQTTREINVPKSGTLTILFRTAGAKPGLEIDGISASDKLKEFEPTNWFSTYFNSGEDSFPRELGENSNVAAQWQRFSCYLQRINQPALTEQFIEVKDENVTRLMPWLGRFFENSGDTAPEAPNGPWTASAYPRNLSPVKLSPDQAKRLTYYHLIEDKWAHVYRYYLLPSGRYNKLWQKLAQSEVLFLDKHPQITWLDPAQDIKPGGLDIVLDRIHDVAAPLVLFSGRLDEKTNDVELAKPGKTWEVIVAKHPEQTLIERNRTLVRQLDYRHTAHTLLRRFAFGETFKKFNNELQDIITAAPILKTARIAKGADEMAQLFFTLKEEGNLLSQHSHDIPLAGRNNLAGMAQAIREIPAIQMDAALLNFPTDETFAYLILSPTGQLKPENIISIELRSEKGDGSTNMLRDRYDAEGGIEYVANIKPGIPLKYETREHLPLEDLSPAQKLSLNIPPRLNAFAKEAVILQYDSLPYYYENMLLLVAQTSTTVSPITSLTQREYEYISPEKTQASLSTVEIGVNRSLLCKSKLNTFWECTPLDAQNRWVHEDPRKSLRLSSLPDTGVIYQFVLEGNAHMSETQAEIFYDEAAAGSTTKYKARQVGRQLFAAPLEVEIENGKEEEASNEPKKIFYLKTILNKKNQIAFVHHEPNDLSGDFTRSQYTRVIQGTFSGLVKLLPAHASADAVRYTLDHYIAATIVTVKKELPPELLGKFDFLIRELEILPGSTPEQEIHLVAIAVLNKEESEGAKTTLLSLYSTPPDSAAIKKLFEDIEDRQIADRFLSNWISEQAVGSSRDFRLFTNERFEFAPPMSFVLKLDASREGELDDIRQQLSTLLETSPDSSFANAVRQLLAHLNAIPAPTAPFAAACVGIEQLEEISLFARVDAAMKTVFWKGALRPSQREIIRRWSETSDFSGTFESLLQTLRSREIRLTFTLPSAHPSEGDLPEALRGRMSIAPLPADANVIEVTWLASPAGAGIFKGLLLNFEEESALRSLKDDMTVGEPFRNTIGGLLKLLAGDPAELVEISVGIAEPDWRMRRVILPDLLSKRLLLGNGCLRFYGWMLESEAKAVISAQSAHRPNRDAIRRLFAESTTKGLGGATIILTARRGNAGIVGNELEWPEIPGEVEQDG
jgi:hypothetical protein